MRKIARCPRSSLGEVRGSGGGGDEDGIRFGVSAGRSWHQPAARKTLERRLSAISQAHRTSGLPSPASTREEPLHSVWAGLVRTKGRAKHIVAPELTPDVVAMVEALPTVELAGGSRPLTTAAKRDRALLLVGFAGAHGRSGRVGISGRQRTRAR